jgi:hypothetical protein
MQFLRLYAGMREHHEIDLKMIEWPARDSDFFCGSGDLVSAYMTIPVDLDVLISLVNRMICCSLDQPASP